MNAGMRLALGQEPAQGREMGDAVERMSRGEEIGRAQIDPLNGIIAKMVVEPGPPGRAQGIAGLQYRAQAPPGAAAHQAKMTAARLRHQFENDARLAIAPDTEHDAFIGPLHGAYVARPARIRRLGVPFILPRKAGKGDRAAQPRGGRAGVGQPKTVAACPLHRTARWSRSPAPFRYAGADKRTRSRDAPPPHALRVLLKRVG